MEAENIVAIDERCLVLGCIGRINSEASPRMVVPENYVKLPGKYYASG
jgi:hypothetical protein